MRQIHLHYGLKVV